MSRKTRHEIKVPVRILTVRAAGRWFEQKLRSNPSVRGTANPEHLRFTETLSRHSGARLRMERAFAVDFVQRWTGFLASQDAHHLLLLAHEQSMRPPAEGIAALAELVCDISAALRRGEGAPPKLDPLQALEAVEQVRTGAPRGQKTDAVGDLAEALGVSRNTLEKAALQGQTVRNLLQVNLSGTPADPALNPDSDRIILTEDGLSGTRTSAWTRSRMP